MSDAEYIVRGPDFLEEIPKTCYGITLYRELKKHHEGTVALVEGIARNIVSYGTLIEQSLRLARSLQNSGIKPNDVIAISSQNRSTYAFPIIATIWNGAVITLINPLYTTREVVHAANISKPKWVFCSKSSLNTILETQKQLGFIEKIIVFENDHGDDTDVETLENFMAKNDHGYKHFEPVEVQPENVACILYSSGTTGMPKGVMLNHHNLNVKYYIFRDPRYFVQRAPGTTASLGFLPFFHGFGFCVLMGDLLLGKCVVVVPRFDTAAFLKLVDYYNIPSLVIVPPVARFLATDKMVDDYDLGHVVEIGNGAAPLSNKVQEVLLKRFKNVKYIQQGYGLTETTTGFVIGTVKDSKFGSTGKLVPEVQVKVVHLETGKSLGPREIGEIWVKGPIVMKGYIGDETNEGAFENGWFKTGDVVYYDEEGYFYVVDRVKELIKYKGFQVAPVELEGILMEHPKILDAAVIGLPDEKAGQLPIAFVVKNPQDDLTEAEVKRFLKGEVAPHKQLRGGVRFIKEIPRNTTGKILRMKLAELLNDMPDL